MKRRLAHSCLLSVALFSGPGWHGADAAPSAQPAVATAKSQVAQQTRQLQRVPGTPIDDLIRMSDNELELLDYGPSPGLTVLDAPGKVFESSARAHDLVALVTITDIWSALTQDRTWVRSTVSAEIVELWKAGPKARGRYQVGGQLVIPWEGGTVSVARKTVRARISWVRHLQPNATYLVFGWFPHGELRIPPQSLYEIVGPRIRSVTSENGGGDDLEQDTLDKVKRRVKDAIGQR